MDEVRAFFNNPCSSSSQVKKLRSPLTGGIFISKEDNLNELNRKVEHRRSVVPSGTDYAREVKDRENELYLKNDMERKQYESMAGGLESLERLTSIGASVQNFGELTDEAMTEVYSKYSFQRKEDTNNLAINEFKQEILDRIRGFSVVIIEGPTGCGKTTQVPQWILDDCYQNHRPCKVIVTQPRRIAAISISKRVAQERGWDVGGLVGYQVGLENKTSADTRITYATTGILLQKLVAAKTLDEYSHIILDEVHERGQEMDFLLLVVKKLLYTVSPNVKVVLMSATFNSKMFADYFSIPSPHGLSNSSCIKVFKKEPMFTVKTFYLNHLTKFGAILQQCSPKSGEPTILPEMHHLVVKLLNAFEHIDQQEHGGAPRGAEHGGAPRGAEHGGAEHGGAPRGAEHGGAEHGGAPRGAEHGGAPRGAEHGGAPRGATPPPSVLVFLPGINEIEDLYNCLNDTKLRVQLTDAECARYNWWVLPLHSSITAEEQVRVFQRAPPGHRKVILATNIAESSITVPDIKYVIDFCLMKTLVADERSNFTSLQLRWAARSNCEQRAGRAGRVRDGRVYRLLTDKFYDGLKQEPVPEIVRCPLERLVLLAKMLEMGPPSDILALALEPPDMSNIRRTLLVLKEIGALKKTVDDEWSYSDGDLTYLGRVMAKLPLDVKVSKLIILGYIYGCLEESIIMAAAMSVKNVFSSPFRERLHAYNSKLTWADGSTSDCIACLNVYKVWRHLRVQNYFRQQGNSEAQWARRFYVQVRALRDMDDMVRELSSRVSREGVDLAPATSPWAKHELPLVLKIIIAGAFYPQYFIQVSQSEDRERDAVKVLGGLDPRNTVYLKKFPDNQPGDIYAAAIKKVVRQHVGDEPRVTFDKNSQKVYLTFGEKINTRRDHESGDPTIPGQVLLPVYKSIKARQLKMDIRIPLLPSDKAQELAAALEATRLDQNVENSVPRLPEVDDTYFPLRICQFINVGKFWVQHDDESTDNELRQIHSALNNMSHIVHTGPVAVGDMYAAPYMDALHRVRVLKLLPRDMVQVLYVDTGAHGAVCAAQLRALPAGARARGAALRCRLARVAPAPLLEPHAHWTGGAVRCFQEAAARGPLLGKVYSVVNGVVAIELLAEGGNLNVNQKLLQHGLAVPCDESYESKINHDLRQTANELNMAQKRAYNKEQTESAYRQLRDFEPPPPSECSTDVCLKGAFSPLETTVHTLMYGSREKIVHIEWSSVNSVLLDTDPQQPHERMVVAANVGQNELSSSLTLRHTTVMPNIPGLPAIIALLFCPVAELRRGAGGARYASVLCGLGGRAGAAPHFPEHDLLLNIDADMCVEDIGWVNHIRHLMDYTLSCGAGRDAAPARDDARPRIPRIIREDLMNLLMKRRKHRAPEPVAGAWEWRSAPEDEALEITEPGMLARAELFPLHAPPELRPVPREALRALKRHNDGLKLLLGRTSVSSTTEYSCQLCGTAPMPTHAMRIHLYSNAHMEKEEDLLVFES